MSQATDDLAEKDAAQDFTPASSGDLETVKAPDGRIQAEERRSGEERDPKGRTEAHDVTAPFPMRPMPDWTILVTAAEAYPEMERVVMSAEREVLLGLHVFQGDTQLRSSEALEAGFDVWSDLLRDAMDRGVSVRILLTDFDPAGIPELHVTAWRRVKELLESMRDHIDRMPELFELQVALPAGQVGWMQRRVLWPAVYYTMRRWLAENSDDVPFAPGWWHNLVALDEKPWRMKAVPPKPLSSTTLHQKFIVADAERAVIGGLDIDERRYDDPKHRRPAPETWHDVTMRVDGPIAADLAQHFKECWDRNLTTGTSLLESYIEHHGLVGARARPFEALERRRDAEHPAPPRARVIRTMSRPDEGAFAIGPAPEIVEIEEAYVEAIGRAKSLIYIETQYLRARAVREALVEAGERESGLHVVILLPGAPEDVAYEGRAGSVQRYGEWLQSRFIHDLRKTFGDRVGIFAIVNERERAEQGERDALFGRGMVYVHSKVMTVDDHTAIVGSANLNGRSMQWDTELCLLIEAPGFVSALKRKLWRTHLGEDAAAEGADGAEVMDSWRRNATTRARAQETTSLPSGGAVPFPEQKLHRFSKRSLFIPENMV